jgi:hypothetical protein
MPPTALISLVISSLLLPAHAPPPPSPLPSALVAEDFERPWRRTLSGMAREIVADPIEKADPNF